MRTASVHLCPTCGYPAQTRAGVATHIGRSHRGKFSGRNRELVRKFRTGYPIPQIADIHGMTVQEVKRVVWWGIQYPMMYEDCAKLSYADPVREVPLAHYDPTDWQDDRTLGVA